MVVQAATVLSPGTKSMLEKLMVLDVAELPRAAVEAVGKERRRTGARSRRQTDVSAGRKRSWCGAAVRVYQTFSDPS